MVPLLKAGVRMDLYFKYVLLILVMFYHIFNKHFDEIGIWKYFGNNITFKKSTCVKIR